MGLQSYPLIVRVCLAVLDLCWALATLELRRIFDLLLLLARVKLHGRRVSRAWRAVRGSARVRMICSIPCAEGAKVMTMAMIFERAFPFTVFV